VTVRKTAKGRYMVHVVVAMPSGPVEVRKTSPVQTRAGAKRYELELRAAIVAGTYRTEAAPTLQSFSEDYLRDAAATNRARTVREKAASLRRAILPALGRLALDKVGTRELDRYRAQRVAAGLHAKTVNDEIALVLHMLGLAKRWGLISEVPTCARLKVPPPSFDFLTFDEAARLEHAGQREQPWGTMIVVALRTGMRRGELRALRWQDVDLVAGRLTVAQAMDDRGVVTPPKNGRTREIPLGEDARQALSGHRHLRGPLVFCRADGAAFTQREMERPLQRACVRAGLRPVGWHVLRHSFASHLTMRGVPPLAVMQLGGWSSLAMVQRYAHLSPDVRRDAVRLLDRGPVTNKKDKEHG
jgi:integrase